ncbi:MAG: hypothetical protein AAGA69_02515 [Pseudomonadota bacterium]
MPGYSPSPFLRSLVAPVAAAALLTSTAGAIFIAEANADDIRTVTISEESDLDLVFLSDPFDSMEPAPTVKRSPRPDSPPKPPRPPRRDRDGNDQEFEESMEAFERSMEEFEREMEAFSEEMEAFGEEMEVWGEKMGAIGDAMGLVAEDCEDHLDSSDDPVVLSRKVEDSSQVVKAVCATGGRERYMSEELTRFVDRHPDLTAAEKQAFLDNRKDKGRRVRITRD